MAACGTTHTRPDIADQFFTCSIAIIRYTVSFGPVIEPCGSCTVVTVFDDSGWMGSVPKQMTVHIDALEGKRLFAAVYKYESRANTPETRCLRWDVEAFGFQERNQVVERCRNVDCRRSLSDVVTIREAALDRLVALLNLLLAVRRHIPEKHEASRSLG